MLKEYGRLTWINDGPHADTPIPCRIVQNGLTDIATHPGIDLELHCKLICHIWRRSTGSGTHQERCCRNVREEQARSKGCNVRNDDFDQQNDHSVSDLWRVIVSAKDIVQALD